MNLRTRKRRQLLITLVVAVPIFLLLVGFFGIHLVGYYLHTVVGPQDPAMLGHSPIEEVREVAGGFIVRRYRVKAHGLDRYLQGNPNQRSDDGYDSVIVISDLSGHTLTKFSHWDSNLKIVVSPTGVTSSDGLNWKP